MVLGGGIGGGFSWASGNATTQSRNISGSVGCFEKKLSLASGRVGTPPNSHETFLRLGDGLGFRGKGSLASGRLDTPPRSRDTFWGYRWVGVLRKNLPGRSGDPQTLPRHRKCFAHAREIARSPNLPGKSPPKPQAPQPRKCFATAWGRPRSQARTWKPRPRNPNTGNVS